MKIKFCYILHLFLLFAFSLSAQTEKVRNLLYIDQRRMHVGFLLGVHTQDLSFRHSGKIQENGEEWYAEVPAFSPGFAVGLMGDLAITESLNLRLTPSLYFGNKTVTFREYHSGESFDQDIRSNYLALPLSVRYSARRLNNYRPYVSTGVSPMVNLSRRRNKPLMLKRFDAAVEVAVGCDFYLPYFKLIPELKFSFGLFDAIQRERKDLKDPDMYKYTEAINASRSRMVSLLFYFE